MRGLIKIFDGMIINIKKRKFLIIIEEYAQFGSLENYLKYMLQI